MSEADNLLNDIQDVPAMPNVIMRALSIMKDPDSSMKELSQIISYDQSLTTKVLALVNSAYYGFPQQINSIQRAISLLGLTKTKNIIVTVAMKPMLNNQGDRELWEHSIKVAVGCEYLADYLKIVDADDAFVAGFLHDIGKMILNIKDRRLSEKVKQLVSLGSDVIESEKMFFHTDHTEMGTLLAKKWQLPILLTNSIKYHHNPNFSSMPAVCSLVYVINKLVQDNYSDGSINKDIMKNLNINIEQPQILRDGILNKANILLSELSN